MRHIESEIQRACVGYFTWQYPVLRPLFFAVPNGGSRRLKEAALMKAEGITAGVADIVLLAARGPWHGLCIEFKTATGRQSKEQKRFEACCHAEGYRYAVVRSFDDFKALVDGYLAATTVK